MPSPDCRTCRSRAVACYACRCRRWGRGITLPATASAGELGANACASESLCYSRHPWRLPFGPACRLFKFIPDEFVLRCSGQSHIPHMLLALRASRLVLHLARRFAQRITVASHGHPGRKYENRRSALNPRAGRRILLPLLGGTDGCLASLLPISV